MSYIFKLFAAVCAFLLLATPALAAPFSAADSNPQVVAYYTSGNHGIVGEQDQHTGTDIVMQSGNSGNFQQWFSGTTSEGGTEGDHSVWKVEKGANCPNGWTLVENASSSWGSYLQTGQNYCVKTNDFNSSNNASN